MNSSHNSAAEMDFLEDFAINFSELCGGLRLAVQHISLPSAACEDERDAHKLLDLMLTGFEQLELALDGKLSTPSNEEDG